MTTERPTRAPASLPSTRHSQAPVARPSQFPAAMALSTLSALGAATALVACSGPTPAEQRSESVRAQGCGAFDDVLEEARDKTIAASASVTCDGDDACGVITPTIGCDIWSITACPMVIHRSLIGTFSIDLQNASADACGTGCTTAELDACPKVVARCVQGKCVTEGG